ncbi:Interleukin-4 [Trichinella spiralis]|uniref:Interleukin-4 n=1 Tax=Trichinella spiralis TaxID=6334 RepID=A0ABR3KDX4_TRISP
MTIWLRIISLSAFSLTVFALQCHYCVHSYKKISDESSIDCLKLERNDTYNQRECTLKETACKKRIWHYCANL